jgi:hypothetical protein
MAAAKKTTVNTGTNLDKLKQAFDASKGSGGGNYNWWRPDWGDNLVRVLPPIDSDDVFFHETARHRVAGEWYYCLKYDIDQDTGRGKSCPICEARTRLFRSGDADLIKIAKDIKAKKQYLMNIVNRKGDDPTLVSVYAGGVKIWNKMVTTMLDDEIDITDVEEGYDFLVKKEEGPKTEAGQFPSYDNSKARRKASPLDEDPKVVKAILDNRNELKEIPRFDDSAVLQAAIDNYIKSLTEGPQDEFYGEDSDSSSDEQTDEPKPSAQAKGNIDDFKAKLKKSLKADDDE